MKKTILVLVIAICYLVGFSQETGTFTDQRDGKIYKTVKIGTQWIMAENLSYKPKSGKYWVYNDDTSNLRKYFCGYLYNWETAQKVAPAGWHLPTKEEWRTLNKYLSDKLLVNFPALKSASGIGFIAMFGGYRGRDGKFYDNSPYVYFWSSTVVSNDDDPTCTWCAWISMCTNYGAGAAISTSDRDCAYSVRLFKND